MAAADGRREEDLPETPVNGADSDGNDEDEWLAAMSDVTPLEEGDIAPTSDEAPGAALADRLKMRQEEELPPEDPLIQAIDRRTLDRLGSGKLPIEARLDLHGLTQAEAVDALDRFLLDGWQAGRRVLLVITGKGTARDGGGVLRSAVPRWLGESSHHEHLHAVGPAAGKHGGDGALYVLLRRNP